ncbi:tetratricopeptide repeat protein [Micromonospora sp. 15K316]|uniref:tetratricopeptide repeat protein n=1 Tax=Micromonospora sp. 15K316 TaxID=2530376 RepID=UPI0010436D85|nr:tetratricopeptide repeat protein [Micromonospora sp. 15K316]TDC37948.1 tetratricopeptide repeat protein [Micromonospora sp. 15K316]
MTDVGFAAQQRAGALMDLGRHDEAVTLLRGVLAEQPRHAGVLFLLARCHRVLGQHAEAMRLIDQALGFSVTQEHLLVEKTRILLAAGRPGYAAAAAHTAIEGSPRSWEAHALLAEALLALGNPTRVVVARRHADTALELAPQVPTAHLLDALLHVRMGRLRAARAACGRALALDPSFEPALQQLALLDAQRDQTGRAARGFTAALAADPQNLAAAMRHAVTAAALWWRLFDAVALAAVAHWALFALLGDVGRDVRLAAALLVLPVLAGAALPTWRRQPAALRWQLRRQLGSRTVAVCLALTLLAVAGLLVNGFAPATESPAGGVAVLLLAPVCLVLAVRLSRQSARRARPALRWLGYRVWARLAARTTLTVASDPRR